MADPTPSQQHVTVFYDPHRYVTDDGEVQPWPDNVRRKITTADGISGTVVLMREISRTPWLADPQQVFGPNLDYQGYLCWIGSFVSDDRKHGTGLGAYAELPDDATLANDVAWQLSPARPPRPPQ
ncbi:MAG: hypothetical protein WBA46_18510 [Thermomicrobiales bacterium]